MKRSINEVEAMALKAARGAGIPLGHSEDFARAVGMLAMTRPDALGCIVGALNSPLVIDAPLATDALRGGADHVALPDSPLTQAYLDRASLDFDTPFQWVDGCAMRGGDMPAPKVAAVAVPDHIWNALDAYAAKTYVPATEASRIAGAGAGAIDND